MIPRIITLSILFSITSMNLDAQSNAFTEVKDLSLQIMQFVTELNTEIDTLFNKERRQSLKRNLGYFKSDLELYLITRKELMDQLNKNDYNVESLEIKETVYELKNDLEALAERLEDLIPLLSSNLSSSIHQIILGIRYSQNSNRHLYLSQLEDLIQGRLVDIEQLKKDGERIYSELSKAVESISEIQSML